MTPRLAVEVFCATQIRSIKFAVASAGKPLPVSLPGESDAGSVARRQFDNFHGMAGKSHVVRHTRRQRHYQLIQGERA